MPIRVSLAVALLAGLAVVGCQQPSDSVEPVLTDAPSGSSGPAGGTTPVAPAVEQTHPDAERTIELPASIELPSTEPIAPAIEPEASGPDPTIEIDPG